MPGRRLRISLRVVKRALSRHNARGEDGRATYKATTYKATIDIATLTPGDEP